MSAVSLLPRRRPPRLPSTPRPKAATRSNDNSRKQGNNAGRKPRNAPSRAASSRPPWNGKRRLDTLNAKLRQRVCWRRGGSGSGSVRLRSGGSSGSVRKPNVSSVLPGERELLSRQCRLLLARCWVAAGRGRRQGKAVHTVFDVRRFTALDMFGRVGALWRRRIVVAEFVAGCLGVFVVAALVLRTGHSLVGGWLLGVAFNYLPLAAHALSLFPDGRLEAELAGLDTDDFPRELGRASVAQFLLVVPFLVALAAAVQLLVPAFNRRRPR